eukprot:Sspe_Gene.11448::Locus_3871_Transcript_1_1_Confidence_1.000_Length_2095::g.11448::m.11448/K00276/AOC3, AOC2, tynA; primary-amine oxidase
MGYPLDPLTAEEFEVVGDLLRREGEKRGAKDLLFSSVELAEIDKSQLYDAEKDEFLRDAPSVPRVALATLYIRETRRAAVATVSLTERAVLDWVEQKPGTQPNIHFDEFMVAEELVQQSPAFKEALTKRGVTDMSRVVAEPWSAGHFGIPQEEGRRIIRAQVWIRSPGVKGELSDLDKMDNPYAHPVPGLVAVVDLDTYEVTVEDDGGEIPLESYNYLPHFGRGYRTTVKPIEISQPQGVSFTVDGHLVKWQGWSFRVGFNWREGLTLHHIDYQEGEGKRRRPIINKISCSEMVVPYFSTDKVHHRKNAFDMGEYGIGFLCNSLTLGCDCLGEIHYFDMALNTGKGKSQTIKNAICLHEEDYGVLWKHTDWRLEMKGNPGGVASARSTRLVISCMATVGNYEYGFFYNFYQDGTLEPTIKATGLVNTSAIPPGAAPECGQALGPGLEAQHHQHCFSYRMDMAVDGLANNSVVETNTYIEEDPEKNPYGNAIRIDSTTFTTEKEARRTVNPTSMRSWKVVSTARKNRVGEPTAYKIAPGTHTAFSTLSPSSCVLQRASFMKNHLWVTPYHPDELFAAGKFPNQSDGKGHGLEYWTEQDRRIADRDVVVWHTVNMHHIVRLEDFPVMPVEYASFSLKPFGFFDFNPALDVPPKRGTTSTSACTAC